MNYKRVRDLYGQPIKMNVDIHQRRTVVGSSFDPEIFGPSLWFILHNGVTNYPSNPTRFVQNGMKLLILNIPLLIPCLACREHFYTSVRASNLDLAVSSRDELFKFFVNVHNYVSSRYGKPQMSLNDAKRFYGFDNPGVGTSVEITYK